MSMLATLCSCWQTWAEQSKLLLTCDTLVLGEGKMWWVLFSIIVSWCEAGESPTPQNLDVHIGNNLLIQRLSWTCEKSHTVLQQRCRPPNLWESSNVNVQHQLCGGPNQKSKSCTAPKAAGSELGSSCNALALLYRQCWGSCPLSCEIWQCCITLTMGIITPSPEHWEL